MFEFIRQHSRLALGFVLLLIIPSFIVFGLDGYQRFTDGANATVATVDGQAITRAEWENTHRRVLDNMRRQQPGADAATLDTPALRRETLDAIVRERTLLAAAQRMHLFPSVNRMARLFDSDPQLASLRGPDGRISRELLAMQGMTPELFDQRLRQDYGTRQVVAGIAGSVPAPQAAASAALGALLQRRAVQLQLFDPNAYRARITPTDADIEAYHKANEARFRAPEQAAIEYVVLDLDALGKSETIADADLRKHYDDTKSRYVAAEERRASHILIKADRDAPAAEHAKAKARAAELLAEVRRNPASFADVAKKHSQDGSAAQGGDLEFFGRGAMVKPFEDAVWALQPGGISDVVQSDFGYHVIRLTDVRGGTGRSFDDARAEVEADLRKVRAQARWAEAAENFTNTVYEQSDSLDPIATKLGLAKQTATVQRTPLPAAQGALASPKLLDAVFGNEALRNKRNTDAVEFGPNQFVAARVLQHTPARTLPLAEVKDRVRDALVAERASALARREGEQRLQALKAAGANAETLPMALTVSRLQSMGMPPPLLDAVLRADPAQLPATVGVDLGAQGYAVARVLQVLPSDVPPEAENTLRRQLAGAWAAAEVDAYVAALKQRFKADIKPAAASGFDAAASAPAR